MNIIVEYVFKSEKGYCPQCIAFGKVYFIQDRYVGGEKYEYALMSRPVEKKVGIKFQAARNMVSFLVGNDIVDDIAVNLLLSQMTVYQCSNCRMIENDGIKYVWDDQKKELREYTEPKQETGYFDTYLECLNIAKEILKKMKYEREGMQLTLFS